MNNLFEAIAGNLRDRIIRPAIEEMRSYGIERIIDGVEEIDSRIGNLQRIIGDQVRIDLLRL